MNMSATTSKKTAGLAVESPDVMLTKEELAAKLKVSVRSIENWKHDGYLPFLKIANVVRFHWPTVLSQLYEKPSLK